MVRLMRGTTAAALILSLGAAYPALAQTESETQSGATPRPAQENGLSQADGSSLGMGNCEVVQRDLDQRIAEDSNRRSEFNSTVIRDLRDMRNAAMKLEQYGQTEACQEVAAAIQHVIENPDAGPQGQAREMQQQQSQDTTGTTDQQAATDEGDRTAQDDAQQSAQESSQSATPISEARIRADELIGSDVRSSDYNTIGEVDDVIVSSDGSASYVIVAHGGFLGIGEDRVAVPFDAASMTGDQDAVVLNMTEEDLEQAPSFQEGDYDWLGDDTLRRENEEFFASR